MDNFENVTVVPKANVYFEGKVVSRNGKTTGQGTALLYRRMQSFRSR